MRYIYKASSLHFLVCFGFVILFSSQVVAYERPNVSEPAEITPVCDANDPTYKKVGGRNICKRECRTGEIGSNGKMCVTKEDTGTGEKLCDCGV